MSIACPDGPRTPYGNPGRFAPDCLCKAPYFYNTKLNKCSSAAEMAQTLDEAMNERRKCGAWRNSSEIPPSDAINGTVQETYDQYGNIQIKCVACLPGFYNPSNSKDGYGTCAPIPQGTCAPPSIFDVFLKQCVGSPPAGGNDPPPPSGGNDPPPPSGGNVPPPSIYSGCGNSYIHIKPELMRVAVGQSISIGTDVYIDPSAIVPGKDVGWTRHSWRINGNSISNDQASLVFKQDIPGTYQVTALVDGNFSSCDDGLRENVLIEVYDGQPAPPPDPPVDPPVNPPVDPTPCAKGYHYGPDGETCIKDGCAEGFHTGADGTTCEKTDINTICPPNMYNNNGTCVPIVGGGGTYDSAYDRVSSNYRAATEYNDVFKTPESDTKPATAPAISTQTILLGLAAVAGIGGIYYFSTLNVKRRY